MRKQREKTEVTQMIEKSLWPFVLAELPLFILLFWSIQRSTNYELVMRQDTMSPAIGVPRLAAYLSLVLGAAYFLVMFRRIYLRFHPYFASHSGHSRCRRIAQYFVMSFLLFLLTVPVVVSTWSMGTFLNGCLDSSSPRTRRVKVIKKVMIGVTPYYVAQDWKNPRGWVYFLAHDQFVKKHPPGSMFTITTKAGWLGYEWYVSGYSVFCGAQNCESKQGQK